MNRWGQVQQDVPGDSLEWPSIKQQTRTNYEEKQVNINLLEIFLLRDFIAIVNIYIQLDISLNKMINYEEFPRNTD